MMPDKTAHERELARVRSEAYRDRKRRGAVLVTIEVEPRDLAALERLALLAAGDRDPANISWAVADFLRGAPAVAALGDALWPARGEDRT